MDKSRAELVKVELRFVSASYSSRAVAKKAAAKEQDQMQVCAKNGTRDLNLAHQLQWVEAKECK